jgi:hypothetical protein
MRTGGRSVDLGSLIDGGGEIREEVEAKDGMCELLTFGSAPFRALEWVIFMGHPLEACGSATVSIHDTFLI